MLVLMIVGCAYEAVASITMDETLGRSTIPAGLLRFVCTVISRKRRGWHYTWNLTEYRYKSWINIHSLTKFSSI
jgi:hypothetical protein